jgi:predicted TIM-barrel fold metal-dependent hydrolase
MAFGGLVSAAARLLASGLCLTLACPMAAHAQDAAAQRQLALEVPIADVHMHTYPGLTAVELRSQMDRNRVRWGGAVGATFYGPYGPNVQEFIQALGPRYIPAGAQPDFTVLYSTGGTAAMENAESTAFQSLLARLEQDFANKSIRGIGELILNNRNSHPLPAFRRKAQVDAPSFEALFDLAAKHGGFVQLHIEDDNDSVASLERLLRKHPTMPVILSHCMAKATATFAQALLARHPQLYCELSARSSIFLKAPHVQAYQIHDASTANAAWVALIEAMPDRFMLGSDATGRNLDYDEIIAAFRTGLLPALREPTLRKVAYGNAQRLFQLPDALQ